MTHSTDTPIDLAQQRVEEAVTEPLVRVRSAQPAAPSRPPASGGRPDNRQR